MKRIIFSAALMAALGLSSCSDQFLEDKQNFDNVTSEVYNDYAGASGRVLDLYCGFYLIPIRMQIGSTRVPVKLMGFLNQPKSIVDLVYL